VIWSFFYLNRQKDIRWISRDTHLEHFLERKRSQCKEIPMCCYVLFFLCCVYVECSRGNFLYLNHQRFLNELSVVVFFFSPPLSSKGRKKIWWSAWLVSFIMILRSIDWPLQLSFVPSSNGSRKKIQPPDDGHYIKKKEIIILKDDAPRLM